MRKLLWMLSIALMPLVAFTACSDDDDNSLAAKVKGTYDVKINSETEGLDIENASATVVLKKQGDTKVGLQLIGFKFALAPGASALDIPVVLNDVTLASTDATTVTLTGTDEVSIEGFEDKLPVNVSGTIKDGKTMDVKVTVSGVEGIFPNGIVVKVTGAKK